MKYLLQVALGGVGGLKLAGTDFSCHQLTSFQNFMSAKFVILISIMRFSVITIYIYCLQMRLFDVGISMCATVLYIEVLAS